MKNVFAIALISAVVSTPAFANDAGAYVGLTFGQATASGNLTSGLTGSRSDTSYGLFGGYQFNKSFAAEVQMFDLGRLAQQGSFRNTMTNGVSLSAVGALPVNDKFSVFAKLGIARTYVKISDIGIGVVDGKNGVTYGLGAQYNFTESIGLRASYDHYTVGQEKPYGTNGTYTVMSAGAVYKF